MLAIILSVLSVVFPGSSPDAYPESAFQADTLKKPARSSIRNDTIRHGRFLNVSRIFIIGNERTREKIILRELSLKTGDVVFSADLESILDLDRKKLLNTRLFNTVEIRSVELDVATVDIIIELNERWYTFPAPIFDPAT
jgi:hypothetical protein